MSAPLFYKKPIVVDRNTHRNLKLTFQPCGFKYASMTNSVPVTTPEFAVACQAYPIVFITDSNDAGMPVVLTGLRNDENLFVDVDGKWDGHYIPIFVRRYPFVLQPGAKKGEFSVLVDSEAEGYNAEDGQRLFNEDGSNTPLLNNVLEILNQFSNATEHTVAFVRQLRKLDLLTARGISAKTKDGTTIQMNGFSVVDEVKLNALNDADLLSLTRAGHLAGIYAHLISLSNIQKLVARIGLV
jgi:hypothetical protein